MKRIFIVVYFAVLCFALVSCSERNRIKRQMLNFVETGIIIPDDLECIYNRHTSNICLDTLKSYKFIIYYDSLDCSSCRISNLIDIYDIYTMADTSGFSVLTVFSPRDEEVEEVRSALMSSRQPVPLYVDINKTFSRLNTDIPADTRFHYFFINGEGVPLFVGNPLASTDLRDLFYTVLENVEDIRERN